MSSQADFAPPPRIAAWLLDLFASSAEAESIQGDLFEEYSQIVSSSGVAVARRWYRRQALKSIAHLAGIGYRTAPWSTTAAILGGFLLRKFAARLVEPAIFAVLDRYQVFEHHFNTYRFFSSTGIDIGHLIVFLFIGCVVALAAKGRELVAALPLALILAAMTVAASFTWIVTGHALALWRLPWNFADSFAIVIGAVIVRTSRSPAAPILS